MTTRKDPWCKRCGGQRTTYEDGYCESCRKSGPLLNGITFVATAVENIPTGANVTINLDPLTGRATLHVTNTFTEANALGERWVNDTQGPIECEHGRVSEECVRCDPWCPRNATEAEYERWQRIVDANRKWKLRVVFPKP